MVKCPNCDFIKEKQRDYCFCEKCGTIMVPFLMPEKKEKKEKDKWQPSTEKTEQ